MTPRQKLALAGVAVAGGLAAFFASTKTASAAPAPQPQPQPQPQPSQPWPADNMPWMMYSATTLSRQREYNAQASIDQVFGFPLIAEDGILGPETCNAFKNFAPHLGTWGHRLPIACAGRV